LRSRGSSGGQFSTSTRWARRAETGALSSAGRRRAVSPCATIVR
jgi:hypothetical protein